MPIPPEPILLAAVRWLERLPSAGTARCRALFTTHSDFSDISPTQYEAALTWLYQTGLVQDLSNPAMARHRVFLATVSSTTWFPDADTLVQGPGELPEDTLRAAISLDLDEGEAYAQVMGAWGKVDTSERERIGAAGELALVSLLSEFVVDSHVNHVALTSDGYGYDIAVDTGDLSLHLEAKATMRRGRLAIYLSRNEYETLRRDPLWQLVVVRLTANMEAAAIATVPSPWIADEVPRDNGTSGRWESCRLDIPSGIAIPGIPKLRPALTVDAPALLAGSVSWPG